MSKRAARKIAKKLRKFGAKAALNDAPEEVIIAIDAAREAVRKWIESEGKE